MSIELRDYQHDAVTKIREAFAGEAVAPLYVGPTGSGKTVLFCYIAQKARALGSRVWIAVHRRELLFQTSRALDQFGVTHGVVAPGFTPSNSLIQICSKDALGRRLEHVGEVDLIVLDEGHHAVAGTWRKIADSRPDARVLGVTATPLRLDGRGLGVRSGGVYDRLIVGPSTQWMIDNGWLCPPRLYGPPVVADLAGVEKGSDGDYKRKALASAMDKPTITGDAVEHYSRVCPGAPSIAFCVSISHAAHVADQFRAAGYRAEPLDGTMKASRRAYLINELGSGRLNVLTSCDIVSEGTDIPIVTAAILLRPTHSLALYLQQVGRVMRPVFPAGVSLETAEQRRAAIAASSKPYAIVLDHVGSVWRHYLPETDREWFLDTPPKSRRRKKDDEDDVPMKQCPACYACHAPALCCPACGHVYLKAERTIETVQGALDHVTSERLAAQLAARDRRIEVGRATSRDELMAIAKQRGYKPAWVDLMLRQRARKAKPAGRIRFDA